MPLWPAVLTHIRIDRTSELRKKGYEGRRLGPVQMTTDTAVRVTRICVQDRSMFSLHMQDQQLTIRSPS